MEFFAVVAFMTTI